MFVSLVALMVGPSPWAASMALGADARGIRARAWSLGHLLKKMVAVKECCVSLLPLGATCAWGLRPALLGV